MVNKKNPAKKRGEIFLFGYIYLYLPSNIKNIIIMIVYNNSKNENIKQFITEANPTKNQLIQFINKSIVKVFDTYYLSDEQNILSDKLYPYNEGDDYYTIENGDIIYSCWDDVSEEMHDENPNKKYFSNTNEAKNYLKAMKIISITTKKQII